MRCPENRSDPVLEPDPDKAYTPYEMAILSPLVRLNAERGNIVIPCPRCKRDDAWSYLTHEDAAGELEAVSMHCVECDGAGKVAIKPPTNQA
jgi:hypothetical protein